MFLSQLLVEACREPAAPGCIFAHELGSPLGAPPFALLRVELPFLAVCFWALFTLCALALLPISARLVAHLMALLALGAFERRMLLTARLVASIVVEPPLRTNLLAFLFAPHLLPAGEPSKLACPLAPLDTLGTPRLLPLHSLTLALHGERLCGADACCARGGGTRG